MDRGVGVCTAFAGAVDARAHTTVGTVVDDGDVIYRSDLQSAATVLCSGIPEGPALTFSALPRPTSALPGILDGGTAA